MQPAPSRARNVAAWALTALLGTASAVVAVSMATVLLLVPFAPSVEVLVTGAALVAGAGAAGGGWVAATAVAPGRRTRRLIPIVAAGVAAIATAGLGAVVLLPTEQQPTVPPSLDRDGVWTLTTGSRIAYDVSHGSTRVPPRPPVIFLHGGPGVPTGDADQATSALARDGYDVYHPDQLGAGRSSRLRDAAGYTVARHVRDLEAIREELGARQLVLVGHSWGTELAIAYAARHPRAVSRLVLVSPTSLDDGSPPRTADPPMPSLRVRLLSVAALQNPRLARDLDAEREADSFLVARFSTQARGDCSQAGGGTPIRGAGYLAHLATDADLRANPVRPSALRKIDAPVLVVRGECDWAGQDTARAALDAAGERGSFACIRGAGHHVPREAPSAYLASLRAFLAGHESAALQAPSTLSSCGK